ncbi:MAG: PfkB family carbohydrate kinase [Candidatus Margulisbacteria bacterium]|jgi:sugar/nucleoside kinase (ribokinase family)|nr:PfkB family carbohydrate kinase [Candidatus Margulisiibacteriota bacterium]
MVKLLIAGTVAYDSLRTPRGERPRILGGSALHAAVAASILLKQVDLLSVVGGDFEPQYLDFLRERGVDLRGLKIIKESKTFAWRGFYEKDLNIAHTMQTDLNALTQFDPALPPEYLDSDFVFLGNIDPVLQAKIFAQLPARKFGALDSMNYWIASQKEDLLKAIALADLLFINDAEIRQLTGEDNLFRAARGLLTGRLRYVIIKKGEHGAMLISAERIAIVPSMPLDEIVDPTGAGDSFAGGFMSYIAENGVDWDTLRAALVYGTLTASFNVQGFGCERLAEITKADLDERLKVFREITRIN